jgi:hypothetical protein
MTSGGTLWVLTTWAHPTDASGGSASEWPTPTATPYGTDNWPTPDTTNIGDGVPYSTLKEALIARRERTKVAVKEGRVKAGSGRSQNLAMAVQAAMWMTPNTMDCLAPKSQAALDHEYTHRKGRSNPNNLRDQVAVNTGERAWPTPTVSDGHGPGLHGQGGPDLRTTATWATPQARDYKDGADPAATIPTNGMLGRQAPRTPMPGPESSPSGPDSPQLSVKRLNADFVDWMMGLPIGWTDSRPLATGSFRRWLRSFFGA